MRGFGYEPERLAGYWDAWLTFFLISSNSRCQFELVTTKSVSRPHFRVACDTLAIGFLMG
jgi:hypothetical protein